MPKVIIYRKPSFRWNGIKRAAKELGVSRTAVRRFLAGESGVISKERRERIVIKTIHPKRGEDAASTKIGN